jgi:UDP-GlcNAc:undecaprenyl-phosphate GlcNAc-1-phosphate transferase
MGEWGCHIASCLLGLSVSIVFIVLILKAHRHCRWAHREDELHHAHKVSIPRFGGIALAAALVSIIWLFKTVQGQSLFHSEEYGPIITGSLAMFGLGLWDDFRPLGAKRKLAGQLLIASAIYFFGIGIHKFQVPFLHQTVDLGGWSWLVTVLWLVAMTNLINLIDGIDGLAGGICLMLMLLLTYVGNGAGNVSFIAAGMAGALLGFLWFNFPPAKIYMGDGGAYFLGFLIGSLTIINSQKGTIFAALIAPLFVLALPILDTALAILRRGSRGLPLFRADRGHIHHRLLESGHSRRKVVLGLYCFTAFFLLLGFAAFWFHGQHLALLLGISVLVVLLAAGKFNFSREWFAVGRMLGNSMEARSHIQYAVCQSRWLALEGARCQSIEKLCEDVVFIARKLGYGHVIIRLEDGEKMWRLAAIKKEDCHCSQHNLPGNRHCFLELGMPRSPSVGSSATISQRTNEATFKITGDLLAEGWAKAIFTWKRQRQLPIRFDARRVGFPADQADNLVALQAVQVQDN